MTGLHVGMAAETKRLAVGQWVVEGHIKQDKVVWVAEAMSVNIGRGRKEFN